MITDRNLLSPTKERWNGHDDAWGSVVMQSKFLDPATPMPNLVPSNMEECESTSSGPISSTSLVDQCCNFVNKGASKGRASLLARQHSDMLHKKDEELKKQLRWATGQGFNTDGIEETFNVSLEENAKTFEDAIENTLVSTNADVFPSVDEDKAVDDDAMQWEERTNPPEVPPELLVKKQRKNVALLSLEKRKQKEKNIELSIHAPVAKTPTVLPLNKVKEDWRAEAKAEQDAKSLLSKDLTDQQTAGGGSLLGNWREAGLENNWSMWAPKQVTEVPECYNQAILEPALRNEVTSPTDIPQVQTQAQGLSHRKKKKNKFVPVIFHEPLNVAERANIAPADFRLQTNGVLPSTRNSDYSPMLGSGNIHSTFGNLFQQSSLGKSGNKKKGRGSFNLNQDEFPTL